MSWWHSKENRINHWIIEHLPVKLTAMLSTQRRSSKETLDMECLFCGVSSTWENSILLRPPSIDWRLCRPQENRGLRPSQTIQSVNDTGSKWNRASKNATTIIVWLFVGEGYTQIIPSSNSSSLRLKNTLTSGRRKIVFFLWRGFLSGATLSSTAFGENKYPSCWRNSKGQTRSKDTLISPCSCWIFFHEQSANQPQTKCQQ